MANGVSKPADDFDATTSVMESDMVLALAKQSTAATGQQQALADEVLDVSIEVVVEAPATPAIAPAPPAIVMPAPLPAPPATATLREPEDAIPTVFVTAPAKRRSPVMRGALAVAALVIAFDFWIFVLHRRPPRAEPAPSLPTYVVLPPASTPVHPVLPSPPPAPAPPPPAVAAAVAPLPVAAPAPPVEEPKPRRHSHHHHSRSR